LFRYKRVDEINVTKKVFSKNANRWAVRGIDKKTKKDGILVCVGTEEEKHEDFGYWLDLSEDSKARNKRSKS
jgi:hypothetical protein